MSSLSYGLLSGLFLSSQSYSSAKLRVGLTGRTGCLWACISAPPIVLLVTKNLTKPQPLCLSGSGILDYPVHLESLKRYLIQAQGKRLVTKILVRILSKIFRRIYVHEVSCIEWLYHKMIKRFLPFIVYKFFQFRDLKMLNVWSRTVSSNRIFFTF